MVGSISLACSSQQRDFGSNSVASSGGTGGTAGHAGASASAAGSGPSLAGAHAMGGAPPQANCAEDEYDDGTACRKLTICRPGEFEQTPPLATKDRSCTGCAAGTFSATENATVCQAWRTCGAGESQAMAGTAKTDVVCADEAGCSTAKDRACTSECPCASGEGVCTANAQCAGGATCVEGSGIKVGRAADTCLATHCTNDKQDSGETSVDCGGECGCRATFETIQIKGVPSGLNFIEVVAMSRDGKRLAGALGNDETSFPAAIAFDGTVTQLESYGKGAQIQAMNGDGNLMVGLLLCGNPPSCSMFGGVEVQWAGSAAPTVLDINGSVRGASISGSILAGDFYDDDIQGQSGFLFNGTQRIFIPEFGSVIGVTPDGKYVAGVLQSGVQGGLWFAQTKAITKIGAANWTSVSLDAVNGTDPAVVGVGYGAGNSISGFRWKGGILSELGLLAGGEYTHPGAVSADGNTIVGMTGTNSFQQAFIWTEKDKLRTIVDELRARGLEPSIDFRLTDAQFVSDDGKVIVGTNYEKPANFWRVVLE